MAHARTAGAGHPTLRGRIVSTLEGGYDLAALRESTLVHVKELLG